MAKIKMKTKKAFSKRFLVTSTGKIKRKQSHRSHLASNKSKKQKQNLKNYSYLNKPQMKRAQHLLQQ